MTRQFLNYAIPSMLAMFVSSLYTIVDGIFVGQGVGDLALAAVNLVMPFTIMLFGIATMLAVGGGALVSKYIGAKEEEKAILIFRQVFKFAFILSGFVSVSCVIFAGPLVKLLGATPNTIVLAKDYMRYYAMFCIPNLIGIILNSFVRNDGRPRLAMIATISGAITNIILDYLFIFPLGLGIKGAAIATGLGQIVTVAIVLSHFLLKRGILSLGNVKLSLKTIQMFGKIGLPSFLAEVTFSVIILLQNIVIVRVMGDVGLAAFSIINYLTTNVYMVLLGASVGVQPLISYNFGAKCEEKMLDYYRMTKWTCVIINIIFAGVCFIFGKQLCHIFTSNPEIIRIGYIGLNLFNLGFFATGFNLSTTMYYQAIEVPRYANMICACRSILIFPICLFTLSRLLGENGVWIAFLISEVLTILIMNTSVNLKQITSKQLIGQEI